MCRVAQIRMLTVAQDGHSGSDQDVQGGSGWSEHLRLCRTFPRECL